MPIDLRVYGAYGESGPAVSRARVAYAGEVKETHLGCYVLGTRVYAPALRRFLGADLTSPFGLGGVNRYAYCGGDPIDRVDPSGNAWWNWLFSGSRATARSGRATDKTGRMPATPDAAAIGSAPTRTVGSVEAGIASGSPVATGGVLGRLAESNTSAGPIGQPRQRMSAGRIARRWQVTNGEDARYLGQNQTRHRAPAEKRITMISDPGDREVVTLPNGERKIEPRWHERAMKGANGQAVSHWLADAPIVTNHILEPLQRISRATSPGSTTAVFVYPGVHGLNDGRNWLKGVRAYESPLLERDLESIDMMKRHAPNLKIHTEVIAGIRAKTMESKMARPGVHVHAYCYSVIYSLVISRLNIDPLPIYCIP
jgi:RHS repeat-associated protein